MDVRWRRPRSQTEARSRLYERWIRAQGGDPSLDALPQAPVVTQVTAPSAGYVQGIATTAIGQAALGLGAGRLRKEDDIDHAVGDRLPREAWTASRGRRCHRRGARSRPTNPPQAGQPRSRPPTASARSRRRTCRSCSTSSPDGAARCLSCPRWRRSVHAWRRASRDGRSNASRSSTRRLTRPEPPEAIAHALEGERISEVGRRGKYLVFEFESGRHLLVHLRMTGTSSTRRRAASPPTRTDAPLSG